MITIDSEKRDKTLSRILGILDDRTSGEDGNLIRTFAPVVFAEMPDRIALRLSPECLADDRLRSSTNDYNLRNHLIK